MVVEVEGLLGEGAGQLVVVVFRSSIFLFAPDSWYEEVIESKDGDPSKISVLGLVGNDGECNYDPTPRTREFIGKFDENGRIGGVCNDDYAGFFAESVTVVDQACNNFPVK